MTKLTKCDLRKIQCYNMICDEKLGGTMILWRQDWLIHFSFQLLTKSRCSGAMTWASRGRVHPCGEALPKFLDKARFGPPLSYAVGPVSRRRLDACVQASFALKKPSKFGKCPGITSHLLLSCIVNYNNSRHVNMTTLQHFKVKWGGHENTTTF